jgi:hypothetical protein
MADNTLSRPDRRNWQLAQRSQSRGLYALALVDKQFANVKATGVSTLSGAVLQSQSVTGPANEFVFNVNPKSTDMEEQAAVQIVPTQDGGQFIEHQGQIYKNITITGTTGLRPDRTLTNVIPVLGVTNPFAGQNIDPDTLMPRSEKSGFDALIELRNLFRAYFDTKADPARASQVIMIWQNGKEGEYYVVEPQVFRTRRDASSPLSYNYEIQLRTIGRVDMAIFRATDSRQRRTGLPRFAERMNEISRTVSQALGTINAVSDRIVGIGQATVTAVLGPARALLDGITGFTSTVARAFSIPRNSIALLATNALEVAESLDVLNNAYVQNGIDTQLADVRHALKLITRASAQTVSEDSLFSTSTSEKFTARASAYRQPNTGNPPRSGGSPTDMNNIAPGGGTALGLIMSSDTIYTLSQRLLGDQARWKELVVLNDLKSPYVSPTGDGKNVLRPSDTVLFPVNGSSTPSGVSPSVGQEEDHLTLRLGRDLRLRSDQGAGGILVYDLSTDTRGDLEEIEGLPNLEQAVKTKFSIEQGELPTHPTFGLQVPIGSKALVRTLVGFQLNARSSLLADSRIANVKRLTFQLTGNVVSVNADLDVADVDQSVGISFDARR